MTLAHGTEVLESARLVLRRVAPDDLPFFTRLHALPEVARHLYPEGRPRSPEETAAWLATATASTRHAAIRLAVMISTRSLNSSTKRSGQSHFLPRSPRTS